ncbi:MAG: response regulator transcription factor [Lachnospiraceae bacterium]|nr:response regulator transcription factor [Lachnospiraceae bacterium]
MNEKDNSKLTVLVCDDEKDIANAISIFLRSEGYNVLTASNGKEALELVEEEEIHLVLLDIMMPVMDGVTALSKIREISNVPVIMLTAKSEDTDKILGLNLGADDYVTKPFNPVELMARVRSGLRRYMLLGGNSASETGEEEMTCGRIKLVDRTKEVWLDGDPVKLTRTEYDILRFLMMNPGKVFTPMEIYKTVWKDDTMGSESIVAVHIRHLREKIEIDPSEPRYIKMIWGRGYFLENKQERKG